MLRNLACISYRFSKAGQTTKKYQIVKLAYLIEARPKRPASPYALFVKQESAGKKIQSFAKSSQQLSQKWRSSPEIQEKFQKLYQENGKDYPQKNEQYIKKYVTPFKKISYSNVLMKKISAKVKAQNQTKWEIKTKIIESYGKQLKKVLEENKSSEIEASKQQALKIKAERQAIINQYKFPVLAYKSFRSYQIRHSLPKEQRGPKYTEELLNSYNENLMKWREQVQAWLKKNNYQITVDKFITLYEKALTAEKVRKLGLGKQEQEQEQE